ncbi:MAG: hypothetical protein WKG03_01740 [Telluria sp.]
MNANLPRRAVLGAILLSSCLSAQAASFDCVKARSTSERLICSDPQLSALDERLAKLAAAGKQRAASPRAYQRALDAAWSIRQKCDDVACVEGWYARRIAALSNAEMPTAKAPAPRGVAPVTDGSTKMNVTPGAQLQVIGGELGFHIPLSREEFLDRYRASGGQCGASAQLPALKALSRSVDSDCWTGTECRAPAPGLNCQMLRTGYDRTGRIVLFTTTLHTVDPQHAAGGRHLNAVVDKFAEFGGGQTRTRDVQYGRVLSAAGTQGLFKVEAEVTPAEGGKYVGTFSVAAR